MSFQFQRRLNLKSGWGINISKSGFSPSFRSKYGSVSTKGVSVRTGIPGISYRHRVKKGSGSGAILGLMMLIISLIPFVINVALTALQLSIKLLMVAYWLFIIVPLKLLLWVILTLRDFYIYKKSQQIENENA